MKSQIATISKPLALILALQLAFGPLFGGVREAQAQERLISVGASQITTRAATEGYTLPKEHRTPDGVEIKTDVQAEEYVNNTAEHANAWAQQCVKSGKVQGETAFVLGENIPYADMKVKNCAQEQEKIGHMVQLADELVKEYPQLKEKLYTNKNCATCGVQPGESAMKYFDRSEGNLDFIPEGGKCTERVMNTVAAESCPHLDKAKNMLSWECLGNLAKGAWLGLKESILGIGKLIGMGAEWLYDKAKKGVVATVNFLNPFKKAEDAADKNAHAASGMQKKQYDEFKKDPEKFKQSFFSKVLDFLKEVVYIGLYERESKCLNCQERSMLLCEIGGRVFNDLVGFTFTMGFGIGAIKTIAGKLKPRVLDILTKWNAKIAASNSKFMAAVERGDKGAKALNAVAKGTKQFGRVVGKTVVSVGKGISQKTVQGWNAFKKSGVYQLLKDAKSTTVDFAKRVAEHPIPKTIVVAPLKWMGRGVRRYINWDDRIMASGVKWGTYSANGFTGYARAAKVAQEFLPKLDKADVAFKGANGDIEAKLVDRGVKPSLGFNSKRGITFKDKWRTWEMTAEDITPEIAASFKRAGIEGTKDAATGVIKFETPNANFKKWMRGTYDTPLDRKLKVPVSKDGTVLVEADGVVKEYNASKMTREQFEKLDKDGAFFWTKEHFDNPMKPLNPNKLDPTYISRDLGKDPGVIAYVEKGEVKTVRAADLPLKDSKAPLDFDRLKNDKRYKLIEGGTDNPTAQAKWTKDNQLDDILAKTQAAQIAKKELDGKIEDALSARLYGVDELKVLTTPQGSYAYAIKAQKELAGKMNNTNVSKKLLEGIQDAEPAKYIDELPTGNGKNRVFAIEVNGETKKLAYTADEALMPDVHIYENGNKAILKKPNGEHVIYDISKPGEAADMKAIVSKKYQGLVDEAMGNTINGQKVDKAAMDQILTNLELAKKKKGQDYRVVVAGDGTRRVEINLPTECIKDGKGTISVVEALAH